MQRLKQARWKAMEPYNGDRNNQLHAQRLLSNSQ